MGSTLEEFLLFEFSEGPKYAETILQVCKWSITPIFIISILIDQISSSANPAAVFKRFAIAMLILISAESAFKSVASIGFEIGNSILKEQKTGIAAKWLDFRKRAEEVAKKEKKSVGMTGTILSFFQYDSTQMIEKGAALLIIVCLLLVKIIYSIFYYMTYFTSGFLAIFAIFPSFEGNFKGIGKSVLYLILHPIMVALVLAFINETLQFSVNSDNFLEGLTEIAKMLVLCFILLGTFKITQSLVNGTGAEKWAGQMGTLLSAGFAHRAMGVAQKIGMGGASVGTAVGGSIIKNVSSGVGSALSTGAYVASRPIASAIGSSVNGFKSGLSESSAKIHQNKGVKPSKKNSTPILRGRYESNFQKVAGQRAEQKNRNPMSIRSSISPVSHLKAMKDSTFQIPGAVKANVFDKVGIPETSQKLTLREKATLGANQLFNGGEVNPTSISGQDKSKSFNANRNTLNENEIADRLKKMNFTEMLGESNLDEVNKQQNGGSTDGATFRAD